MQVFKATAILSAVTIQPDNGLPTPVADCQILGEAKAPMSSGICIVHGGEWWYLPLVSGDVAKTLEQSIKAIQSAATQSLAIYAAIAAAAVVPATPVTTGMLLPFFQPLQLLATDLAGAAVALELLKNTQV